jgi:hypothetical protein
MLTVNYYNYSADHPVPATIFIARRVIDKLEYNYMVDPNDIILSANVVIDTPQVFIGAVARDEHSGKSKALLNLTSCGGMNVVSGFSEHSMKARDSLFHSAYNTPTLEEVLELAGGVIVRENTEGAIDLTPQSLDKTTIINILQPTSVG